jgi:hypothetical protein
VGGLRLSSRLDPTEFWFFSGEEEAEAACRSLACGDLLALHEQLLGRSPGQLLSSPAAAAGLDVEPAGASFVRKLRSGAGAVRVTAAGVAGDSGMGSPAYLLGLGGASRARLLSSERGYRDALARRRLLRAVTRPTVCEGAFCMALNLGLDNRQLLPPFLPVQRNQDGVFAAVLRACFGDAYFGFLPWVLLHQPPAPRAFAAADRWRSAARIPTGQVIEVLIRSAAAGPAPAGSPGALRALGRALARLASLPPEAFQEHVRLHLWDQVARQALQLEKLLLSAGHQPGFWADDVRQFLAAWREALPGADVCAPPDLAGQPPAGAAPERLRRLALRFGQLLQHWPDLVEAARELRARGLRPAGRV